MLTNPALARARGGRMIPINHPGCFGVRAARLRKGALHFVECTLWSDSMKTMKYVIILSVLSACAGQSEAAKKAEAETTYGAEQSKCAATSETLDASRACRTAVDARWGVDGGQR